MFLPLRPLHGAREDVHAQARPRMEDDDMRSISLVCTAFIAACGAGTSPEQPARSQNALTAPSLEIGRPHVYRVEITD